MVVGRDRDLTIGINVIQDGGSLDIVGSRGSGRTAFLEAMCLRLENGGWSIIRLRGVASLRQHPLAAMQLARILRTTDSRPLTLQAVADALDAQLRGKRSVLVVDDWDDLDEASWGIVEGARRSLGVSVVISRLQGRRARHTPSGLDASTLEPAFVIEMSPLRFDELEVAVESAFGGPVEAGTMRRIYAKSGGIPGLATSVVAAAVREGRMRRVDGAWTATRDLWSAGLRGVVEAHLENLSEDAKDALEIIALVGDADIDTVRKLVDWPTLELLEQRAMIQMVTSGNRQIVTVVPPLLVEFFRHEPLAARRIRLRGIINERLGAEPADLSLRQQRQISSSPPEHDAALVRLLHERIRTRGLVARAEWDERREAHTAIEYAVALMNEGADALVIGEVLDPGAALDGDPLALARLAVLQARWAASGGDVPAALSILRSRRSSAGEYRGILAAAEVTLQCEYDRVPEDFHTLLEVDDLLPDAVRAALWDAQILVLNTLGRFDDAARVFTAYESDKRASAYMPGVTRALTGISMLGRGRLDDALTWCLRGVDESFGVLDLDAARVHGTVAAICMVMSGDSGPVEDLIATLVAAGVFPPTERLQQRSLLTLAALVAVRRGNPGLGERYLAELDALPGSDGLLPAQSVSWVRAQFAAFNGNTAEAASTLWGAGEELWDRGGRGAALLSMLNACELLPRPQWLAVLAERMALVSSPLLAAQHAFVDALASANGERIANTFPDLDATGRRGLALFALRRAARTFHVAGDEQAARALDARAAEYLASLPGSYIDVDRFSASTAKLTDREVEIARLVAEGLSNPAIASQLVLSVRTVESHMHRIMRKLALPNRRSVGDYISNRTEA